MAIELGSSGARNKVDRAGDTMTGSLQIPAGSSSSPSLTFTGSPGTGLSSPSPNILVFSTNSNPAITIGSTGAVVIESVKTPGSVIFIGSGGQLTENNSKFFWDNNNIRLGVATLSPQATLDVAGTQIVRNNFQVIKNGIDYEVVQDSVDTSNNTPTLIKSFQLPNNSVSMVEFRITGMRISSPQIYDSSVFIRHIKGKNIVGNCSVSRVQSTYTEKDISASSWNVSIDFDGVYLRCFVTGDPARLVRWHCTTIIQTLIKI